MSRGLGQTELLEPPKVRKLIVPDGAVSWWGVDPSSVRVAIATVSPGGRRGVSLAAFAGAGPSRLHSVYRQTQDLARNLIAQCDLPPGVIAVEQPSGKTPNPMLVYATGAILAALASCVPATVQVVMVTSSQWKALACGKGNIYKPKKPCAPEDYLVLRWARESGYTGTSWDAADAWGIAEWARRTFELEVR